MRLFLVGSVLFTCTALASLAGAESSWAYRGPDGRMVYRADEQGNTIPDFSRAGYGGGGVALPSVPVVLTLEPLAEGDDGARIQAALDEIGARPADAQGFRGALLLKRGQYRVAGSIAIQHSGVVLRGEGKGQTGSVIVATGKRRRTLIRVAGPRGGAEEIAESRRRVVDAYVPWSAKSFEVESVDGLSVGERIILFRPSTAEWIDALGMNRIVNRPGARAGSTRQWRPGSFDLRFERTIVAIEGRRLTLDAPVMNALDGRYGGGFVYRYRFPRIQECGVENLRLVSEYERGRETSDEAHAWTGVELNAVENAWVRDLIIMHFSHGVQVSKGAIFTTVQDVDHLEPVSVITGSKRYSFILDGQYGLALRCRSTESRHTCITGAQVTGPNVFLDCKAERAHADSGPHHRWAVGTLYDNVHDDYEIRAQDRQWAGSGHGWAGAQQVFWNCVTKSIVVQQPPTAQNYAIGCKGEWVRGQWSPDAPNGVIEHPGRPVALRSLYVAQLEDRLGAEAVAAAIGPEQ